MPSSILVGRHPLFASLGPVEPVWMSHFDSVAEAGPERAMTATPARLPETLLAELASRIVALDGVSGTALDITSKPPGTIERE